MNFQTALSHAKSGRLIKRPHWLNPLRYRKGVLEFETAVEMKPGFLSRTYGAPKFEREAPIGSLSPT